MLSIIGASYVRNFEFIGRLCISSCKEAPLFLVVSLLLPLI